MSNRPFDNRGWIEFENGSAALTKKEPEEAIDTFPDQVRSARATLNAISHTKITGWIDEAKKANNAKNTKQQNYQPLVDAVLSKKRQLDMLMNELKRHLREINDTKQLTYIEDKEKEIEKLATALGYKQDKDKGKGPAKKRKTNRRRNKRDIKLTRRRRRIPKH